MPSTTWRWCIFLLEIFYIQTSSSWIQEVPVAPHFSRINKNIYSCHDRSHEFKGAAGRFWWTVDVDGWECLQVKFSHCHPQAYWLHVNSELKPDQTLPRDDLMILEIRRKNWTEIEWSWLRGLPDNFIIKIIVRLRSIQDLLEDNSRGDEQKHEAATKFHCADVYIHRQPAIMHRPGSKIIYKMPTWKPWVEPERVLSPLPMPIIWWIYILAGDWKRMPLHRQEQFDGISGSQKHCPLMFLELTQSNQMEFFFDAIYQASLWRTASEDAAIYRIPSPPQFRGLQIVFHETVLILVLLSKAQRTSKEISDMFVKRAKFYKVKNLKPGTHWKKIMLI